ncbi:radical SAM protein [Helicobacter pametensis]|uniref:radical SAM protein n=1 Tax=Helicobacter pametensis TaxID=95149 RepID=UPI0004AFFE2B|nr:radical SAM protein [Helicobacter pametensis]
MKQIVFGPILSRRFGLSLGVDLSPMLKQCNFDCVYCELGGAKTVEKMTDVIALEKIIEEIQEGMEKNPEIDVLSVTANGEPTLYPFLLDLSSKLKVMTKNRCKTLILSNGSCFGTPQVQEALQNFDIVKFSLDCISDQSFKKLDRPHKSLNIKQILEGIEDFARGYCGELVAEVLVIEGINDDFEEMKEIASFLRRVGVSRVDLGSLDRPPAYKINGVDNDVLLSLREAFEGLCVSIPTRKGNQKIQRHKLASKEELLEILARRPIAEDEFCELFVKDNLSFLEELLQEKRICVKNVANMKFFTMNS